MKREDSAFMTLSIILIVLVVLFCLALLQQCTVADICGYKTNAPDEPSTVTIEDTSLEEPLEIQEQGSDESFEEVSVVPTESAYEPVVEPPESIETVVDANDLDEPDVPEYVSPYQEIDWSQFVFSDDAIGLPDGLYYSTVYVNEYYGGEVETLMVDGEPLFSRDGLEAILSFSLSEEGLAGFLEYSQENYSLEYLASHSQNAWFDSNELMLYLDFSASSMPTGIISIRGESARTRFGSYAVMGAVDLEPAKFSFVSNVNLTANAQHDRNFQFDSYGVSLGLSNTFSMFNATFNLPLMVSYDKWSGLAFSIGNLYGYKDFPDESLRLSFGGVGSYSFGSSRHFGVILEKNYAFGTQSALYHQYSQTIELEEDSIVEVFINGRSVYRESHWLGIYLLRDFIFTQGVNDVTVVVHPLSMGDDTSRDRTFVFSQDYDTALLAKGDDTWRFGMAVPIGSSTSGLGAFWEHSIGLSHEYTQSNYLSMTMRVLDDGAQAFVAKGGFSAVLATKIGTTRFNLSGSLETNDGAVMDARVSGSASQSFFKDSLKPLSLSISFSIGQLSYNVSLNSGYSFKVGSLGVGTGASLSYSSASSEVSTRSNFNARVSLSLSMPLSNGFNVSLSSNLDSSFNANVTLSITKSFEKKTSMNASYAFGTSGKRSLNIGMSHNVGRSSFGLSLGGFTFSDMLGHSVGASWTYRGDLAFIALREQVSNRYSSFSTSASIGTSIAFADGHFAMASNIGGPFLIVSPESKARNLGVNASYALNSNPISLAKTFGNFLYTGLALYTPNNVFVSISQGGLLSSNASLYRMTPYAMQGFVASIAYEVLTTATGVVTIDGKAVSSYSSPVCRIQVDGPEADSLVGVASSVEVVDSAYIFTDDSGRFVLSELSSGTYMFDLNVDGLRYAVVFNVPESIDVGYVLLLEDVHIGYDTKVEDPQSILPSSVVDSYHGVISIGDKGFVTEDEFWDIVFGI